MTNNSKKTIQILSSLLLLCIIDVLCVDSSDGVKMKVWTGPDSVKELINENLPLSLGNFGYVPWGKSISGIVYPSNPANACTPIKPITLDDGESSAPIILVRRGECTFVTKVSNARAQGARMVIIANNKEENVAFVEMVEDNTGIGQSIDIPTVMISENHGKLLEKAVADYYKDLEKGVNSEKNQPIVIHVKFPWNKREKAAVEMWVSPGNPKSMDFVASFKDKGISVLQSADFEPRHAIWRCNSCKDENTGGWPETVMTNCLGGGQYCQPDPDDDGKLDGTTMVKESLRQLCVRKLTKDDEEPEKYFEYVRHWNKTCVYNRILKKLNTPDIEACSKDGLKAAGINAKKIEECMKKSWEGKENLSKNKLLEPEADLFNKRSIAVWPAVIINNQTFKGNMLADEVVNSVCIGFELDKVPDACKKFVVDPTKVIDNPDYYDGGNFWGTFFWVLFFLAIIMVIFFYYYRRFVRRAMVDEMNDQIQHAVATYFKMGDKGPGQA